MGDDGVDPATAAAYAGQTSIWDAPSQGMVGQSVVDLNAPVAAPSITPAADSAPAYDAAGNPLNDAALNEVVVQAKYGGAPAIPFQTVEATPASPAPSMASSVPGQPTPIRLPAPSPVFQAPQAAPPPTTAAQDAASITGALSNLSRALGPAAPMGAIPGTAPAFAPAPFSAPTSPTASIGGVVSKALAAARPLLPIAGLGLAVAGGFYLAGEYA